MSKSVNTSGMMPDYYVAIGASAGGLEAIEKFFGNMPNDSGMSFIVIQHLSPDYKSLMVELLSKHTRMPVKRAEDGMLVEKDTVYLIPPKNNLTIFHGKLILSERNSRQTLNLPVDIFFSSLANDQGEKAIGIVLSGTGSDGTRGVKSIKEMNGVVIAQAEDTAQFDAMPKNVISTGSVDLILPPEEIPEGLLAYVKNPYVSKQKRAGSQDGVDKLLSIVRDKTSVDFSHYKPSTILRRIERRIAVNQVESLADYMEILDANPSEIYALYKDILIGVTNFFRDKDAFDFMKNKVIPDILRDNDPKEEIRVWVAGCSTGEEAYSLAIIFVECMESMQEKRRVKIFATDIDEDAILFAGNGEYHESIAADVPSGYLAKYFTKKEGSYLISRYIREMVVFAKHNLIKDPPFTKMNLISCRNLLIYFQPVLQKRAHEMFSFALNKGGHLFLGTSETTGEMLDNFETIENKLKIFRSRNRTRRISSDQELMGLNDPVASRKLIRSFTSQIGGQFVYYEDEKIYEQLLKLTSEIDESAVVVVNEQNEIIHMFGDVNTYLELPTGRMNSDITKLVKRELSIPLATGVQRVVKKGEETQYSNISLKCNGEVRNVRLHVKQLFQRKNQQGIVAIIIERQKYINGSDLAVSGEYDVGKEVQQRIMDLEQELQYTKESLQATIEELETSNEELQATNEELLASNEELQSTNEELQSVNEELYTVNSEHQDKIFELTELNNDLDNLLNSTQIGTLFLDENLNIRKFTPMVGSVLNIQDSDRGRPLADLTNKMENMDLVKVVKEVYVNSKPLETEVKTVDGSWFFMRVLPYSIAPGTYSGVVVTFIEINEMKQVSTELDKHILMHDITDKQVKIGHWDWDIESDNIVWMNVAPIFGLEDHEFDGTYEGFLKYIHPEDVEKVKNAVKKSLETGEKYNMEHRLINKQGEEVWVHDFGQVHYNINGKPERMMGVVHDITEKIHLAKELADNEEFMSSLNAAALVGIGLVRNREIVYVNKYIEDITGFTAGDLGGESSRALYETEEEFEKVDREKCSQIEKEGKSVLETEWTKKDGGRVKVLLSSVPLDRNDIDKGVVFTVTKL